MAACVELEGWEGGAGVLEEFRSLILEWMELIEVDFFFFDCV